MITLLTFPEGLGQFSVSPFCVKAALLLQASGLEWTREDLKDPRKMPMQKLPCIRVDGQTIADSENIRLYLENKGQDFDHGLTAVQKAQGHAMIRMAEEHLYFYIVMDRWGNDDVWPTIRELYFDAIPKPLRKLITNGIRKNTLRGLHAQGIGRMKEQQRFDRVNHDLEAIKNLLGAQDFLFGTSPSAADYSVGPMISNMMICPVETKLSKQVAQDSALADYANRVAGLLA